MVVFIIILKGENMWELIIKKNHWELWKTSAGYLVCDKYNGQFFFYKKFSFARDKFNSL